MQVLNVFSAAQASGHARNAPGASTPARHARTHESHTEPTRHARTHGTHARLHARQHGTHARKSHARKKQSQRQRKRQRKRRGRSKKRQQVRHSSGTDDEVEWRVDFGNRSPGLRSISPPRLRHFLKNLGVFLTGETLPSLIRLGRVFSCQERMYHIHGRIGHT